ncbi:polynucleotide kinase-phosphatase [Bacillus sp. Hm123]|uniref:polynucleotide kinase-phosphatase n=1 Tax=Bacillus sp. Hm123 TaxID=3450745 RepID=UPI003F4425B5
MQITLPYAGIVLLVGPSNSGKTTFLQRLIDEQTIVRSEVVSSDDCRVLVSDIEYMDWRDRPKLEADQLFHQYQQISKEAFTMMDALVEARCRLNKLTFIDATHLHPDDRKRYISMARKHHVPIIAIILDAPQEVLLERDEQRDHPRGKRKLKQQFQTFKREKRFMKKEGYKATYILDINDLTTLEMKRSNNPIEVELQAGIDVIGDIHGCFDEMIALLEKLGYKLNEAGLYVHPDGRKFVSLGDVMSRSPRSLDTMLFFLRHIKAGLAYMIDSNHGWKIARWLDGRKVTLTHGDEQTAEEFVQFEEQFGQEETVKIKAELKELLLQAPSHYVFTQNGLPALVCTHAGIKDKYIGKQSRRISDFCRYGDTDGVDDNGKPLRKDWFIHHNHSTLIVWGHDPKPQPLMINNTMNIDQGVVFGGQLTALRFPEKEFVAIKAAKDYSGSADNPLKEWEKKRLDPPNIVKFLNGYSVLTSEVGEIKVHPERVKSAIDSVSHFTVPIEQLIYVPPTMSPTPKAAASPDYLEHPQEAIDYYRSHGIEKMVAEKKHMGSRAVLFLFKDETSAKKYVGSNTLGTIYTKSGRRFFDSVVEKEVVAKISQELNEVDYFNKYHTDFVLLDAEIMPWNLKAKELISNQYAHVAENAILDRTHLKEKLAAVKDQHPQISNWLEQYTTKLDNASTFKNVFQTYCWDINGIEHIQIAPFHVLAHSNETFFDKPHTWHMEKSHEFAQDSTIFVATEYKMIEDETSEQEVIRWWEDITKDGHEGIIIKPESFLAKEKGKLLQPAIKVRGRQYLTIIYGMDYLEPANLERLKERNTGKKQKHALLQFALGIEAIQRFVHGEPIERVHECALAILAMEAEPVDPRL